MGENLSTIIIVLVLVLICIFAARKYIGNLRHGCCGGGPDEVKVRVKDKNTANYPYTMTLKVEGMSCSNCTSRVENALNRLDGVWAKVSLKRGEAIVLAKNVIADDILRQEVARAGYKVTEIIRG